MKKTLLFLLCVLSIKVMAQTMEETAIFDFSNPESLNPSVTPHTNNGGEISILQTFTDNGVSVTFEQGPMPDGVVIKTIINEELDEDDEEYRSYSLVMRQTSLMTVKVAKGCLIKSVTFSGYLGEVKKKSGEKGKWNNGVWDAGSDEVSQIVFQNNRTSSAITQVKVTYVRAATPLTLESTTPEEGSTISAFRSITLQFNTKVTEIVNSDGFTLSGPGIDGTMALTPSAAGKSSIALSIDSSDPAITTYGDYTVSVPEGAFKNSEGSVNEAIACTFKIDPIRTTLFYETVSPEEGTYTSLEKDIILSFGEDVSLPPEPLKGKMYKGNATTPTYSVTLTTPVDGDQTKVMLTNSHDANITETGEWRIVIPEGAVHNVFYGDEADDRWNEEFTLTYTIHSAVEAKREEASALLAKKGLGYPASDSDGRTALSAAVADEEVTEESLTAAIDQFLAETNVTMPTTGKWYTIAGANSSGEKIYLTLSADGSRVGLARAFSKAAAFKATVSEGTVVFETKGGKFLHVLTTLPLYDKTTGSNLTDLQSDVNNLTLAKFAVGEIEGVDAASLLGLFTIHGSLGIKEGEEEEKSAYALLKYTGSGSISTDPGTGLKFDESLSSAFVLAETTEPADPSEQRIMPDISMYPSAILAHAGDPLTLRVLNVTQARLKDDSLPYFNDYDSQKVDYDGKILEAIDNEPYSFNVNTAGLAEGTYLLVIPVGTFEYDAEGGEVDDIELSTNIIIKASDPDPGQGGEEEYVTPEATLSATSLKAGEGLTLTIQQVDDATLSDKTKPYYTKDGKKVSFSGTILAATSQKAQFSVNTAGLEAGSYVLNLPVGTFTYTKSGKTVNDVSMTVPFSIVANEGGGGESGETGLIYSYSTVTELGAKKGDEAYKDVDLNDMVLYHKIGNPHTGLVPDPQKVVKILFENDAETVIASGHFEAYPEFTASNPGTQAIKLVLDKKIKSGSLEKKPGTYTYVLEAATFGDANFAKYLKGEKYEGACYVNPEGFILTRYVNNVEASKQRPSFEVLSEAEALLKISGLGYPSENSAARRSLEKKVESNEGTDAEFQEEMRKFYTETDVEKPVHDKYYKVYSQSLDGTKRYFTYDGRVVGVSKDAKEATGFKLIKNANGTYQFITGDGKYLRQPSTAENTSMSYAAETNAITVSKLEVKDVDAVKTFGLFSLFAENAYALVNVNQLSIESGEEASPFTATKTCGFMFEEIADLTSVPVPAVTATLDPVDGTELETLTTVTVVFSVDKVELVDKDLIVLTDQEFNDLKPESIARVEGKPNKWALSFKDVPNNDQKYRLTIDKGAFAYTFAGVTTEIDQMNATYNVDVQVPRATDAQKKEVKRLLALTGVGYPTADNAARKALAALSEDGTEASYKAALEAFYAETDVVKPETGKYYKVIAVTSSDAKAYLTYDGQSIGVTTDASKATGLRLEKGDSGYYFVTVDGKFLAQLPNAPTTDNTSANVVDISRLIVKGVSNDLTLGRFSLKIGTTYTQIDVKNAKSLKATSSPTVFDTEKTNGFIFETVDVPRATDAQKKEVKRLLALTGVGYPTADNAARKALAALSEDGTEAIYKAALDAFYAETDVVKPETGKYYKVIAVTSGEAKAYLTYDGQSIGVTTDASKATGLKLEKNDNGYYFVTVDGKFLAQLPNAPTTDNTSANVVDISRLIVKGVSNDLTLGRFSLKIGTTYTQIDVKNAKSLKATSSPTVFGAEKTNGFIFETVDVPRATDAQKKEVKRLLALTGVGYPTADNAARKALAALSEDGTEALYKAVLDAFYAETDVVKPETGRYYKVIAVTSSDAKAYLTYDGKSIGVTTDASKATGLKLAKDDKGYYFVTGDGKYLAQLPNAPTTDNTSANVVDISRLIVKGVSNDLTLGRFGLKIGTTYTQIDVKNAKSLKATSSTTVFDTEKTNGFIFETISNTAIPVPEMTAKVTPESGTEIDDYFEQATVSFEGPLVVELADKSKITLAPAKGKTTIAPASIKKNKDNEFVLEFKDVPLGQTYALTIGDGAFSYKYAEQTIGAKGLKATYTVIDFRPTAAQLSQAEELLQLSGLGYPKADSQARKTLADLLTDRNARVEQMATAIEAFINDTEVELPANEKYYSISAVANDGTEAFVKYDGVHLSFVSTFEEASSFMVQDNGDGTTTFVCADGTYLTQLTQQSKETPTTDEFSKEANALVLARLSISNDNVSPEKTMGYFSICDQSGAYALVDVTDGTIWTNAKLRLDYFDKDWTNAFRFMLKDGPDAGIHDIMLDEVDGAVYDMTGRRVAILRPGQLYIRNGKKFVAK